MVDNDKVILNGVEVTREVLEEKKRSLSPNERIVETSPNNFTILERMNG